MIKIGTLFISREIMGLFTKEEKGEVSAHQMKPIIVRTGNIAKELLQTASTQKVSVHSLDFNLLDIQTFSRMMSEGGQEDWIELTNDEINDITEELFLNSKFELKQVYEIEIFLIDQPDKLHEMDVSIGGNSTLCKIYLTIKPGSIARYNETFETDFVTLINKKKLRANVMIGVFDSVMPGNLKDVIAKIRVNGEYRFETQERYLVAESYEPIETINDKLILHYDLKGKNKDEKGRVDYTKRGYLNSVVKDELLIEYIKPQKGENGRNCRGELIAPKEPIVRYEPTFGVSDAIGVIDTQVSIEYRAKSSGYVTFEGGIYDIRTEIEVTEISFKSTGSIESQLDADVSINVREKDPLKDAIGMGMEVKVNIINVDGNVGPNAKVTAHKATIEGQVHQSAVVSADELSISVLKGTAYGKEVHITRLEQGIVEADKVTITQASGGKIRAKEIIIEVLGSHVTMTASKKIEIKKLHGGENVFIIDPLLNESSEHLNAEAKKMTDIQNIIRDIQKELSGYEKTMEENGPSMEELKRKLIHYKNNGIKTPSALVERYQEFQQFKQKLDALRDELKQKKDQYTFLSTKHNALQSEIFDARVINHDQWRNYNEIIFKLIKPAVEISHVPAQNSNENILGLHEDDEGNFSIKVISK